MTVCPVCNGLKEIQVSCGGCGNNMKDYGRVMDFYDNYSAYMPIDQMKLEDGYPDTYSDHKCPHFYQCPTCQKDEVIFIKE
ncbi:hypothetical protein RCG23_06890 [Neobacillus sp. PS3-34]|uniref:hypothetical protein n=1 Tax=Neobacillus sp. PS3-34 TaxID=3070678 RepID=UPI0027E129BE|nr:hypothetical protein [Neobacillus sp. PS3-34]WML49674.1 hypothetical protein RCG23_06890 [Neobacillus sp. PS3-34]